MPPYDWLEDYLLSLPGAEYGYKAEWNWHRYTVGGRHFAALCRPEEKYRVYGGHPLVNLKCDPRLSAALQETYPDILPGFYCDKRTWIAVLLDGAVPEAVLRDLCVQSHRLAAERLPQYVRRTLGILTE